MPSTTARGRSAGFTLIEVMIVLAIVGILAAIAYPSYGQFVQKTRRSDAHLSLLAARQAMERCRSTSYSYANCTLPGAAAGAAVDSEEGHYTLALSDQTASAFLITATAKGGQLKDVDCRKLSIDQLDDTKGLNASDAASDVCWD